MYMETSYQAKMNTAVRAKSVEKVKNGEVIVVYSLFEDVYKNAAEAKEISFREEKHFMHSYIYGYGNLEMEGGRLTRYKKAKLQYSSRSYCIDEVDFIWDIFSS